MINRLKLLLCWHFLLLYIAIAFSTFPVAAQTQASWAEPQSLLPNVREPYPGLCRHPLNDTLTYSVGSGAWGIVAANEAQGWSTSNHLKLFDQTGSRVNCSYDPTGTLHVVWSGDRNADGYFNAFYNSVVGPANTIGAARNLTQELYGTTKLDMQNVLAAYSPATQKLFLVYTTKDSPENYPLWFAEWDTQHGGWSKPLQLGAQTGYRPAEPALIVDKNGWPHVFYGEFNAAGNSQIVHHYRKADGSWSTPRGIVEGRQRPIFTKVTLAPQSGDIFVTWTDGPADVAHWVAATDQWQLTKDVTGSPRSSQPTLAVTANETLTLFWYEEQANAIYSKLSTDKGLTWQSRQLVANLAQARIGTLHGMNALAAHGQLYLLFSADQLDPLRWQGATLFVTTLGESVTNPATPTPNPTGTLPPLPTATLKPTSTPANPTFTPAVTRPPVTPTLTPTATPTITRQSDEYEPDSSVAEALAHNRYLQVGRVETHTLYNPANPAGGYWDVDIAFFQAEAGKIYHLAVVTNGFQPKLSLYHYQANSSIFITAVSACENNQEQICYDFTPSITGLYFGQFSSFNGEAGSPTLAYNLTLTVKTVTPTPTPTVSPSTTSTALPTVTPTPTSTPTPRATATPSPTPANTATPTSSPTVLASPTKTVEPEVEKPNPTPQPTILPAQTSPATATVVTTLAILTPQFVRVPIVPASKTGRSPITPAPPTQLATATPKPTPTVTPLPTPTVKATVTPAAPTTDKAREKEKNTPAAPTIWLLPLGLALVAKGFLNLLGLQFRPRL